MRVRLCVELSVIKAVADPVKAALKLALEKLTTAVGLEAIQLKPEDVPVVTANADDPPLPVPQALPETVKRPPVVVWTHWPEVRPEIVKAVKVEGLALVQLA